MGFLSCFCFVSLWVCHHYTAHKNLRNHTRWHRPGVLGRSPLPLGTAVSQCKGKETVFKHSARWLTRQNPVLQNIIIINTSISGTTGSKDGVRGLRLEAGASRLNGQSCHSSLPPAPAVKQRALLHPGQLNSTSAGPSAGLGATPLTRRLLLGSFETKAKRNE